MKLTYNCCSSSFHTRDRQRERERERERERNDLRTSLVSSAAKEMMMASPRQTRPNIAR